MKKIILIVCIALTSCHKTKKTNQLSEYPEYFNYDFNQNKKNGDLVSQNEATKTLTKKEDNINVVDLTSDNRSDKKQNLQMDDKYIITKHFKIPKATLDNIISNQKKDIVSRIKDKSQFLEDLYPLFLEKDKLLMLVDKKHSIKKYAPEYSTNLDDYKDSLFLNKKNLILDKDAINPLIQMTKTAKNQGVRVVVSSTYRDYNYQDMLFKRYTKELGEEEAARQSARPGTSQHQTGLAMDFGSISPAFSETKAGKWLVKNSCDYGFSLSYPKGYEEETGYMFEIWHYRYIGKPACHIQKKYFLIQQFLLEFWHDNKDTLKKYLK